MSSANAGNTPNPAGGDLALKLAKVEAEQNYIKDQFTIFMKGETLFFKRIQWFGQFVLATLAIGGIFNFINTTLRLDTAVEAGKQQITAATDIYKIQADAISKSIEQKFQSLSSDSERRINQLNGTTKISSANWNGNSGDTGFITLDYYFTPQDSVGGSFVFQEVFAFNVTVSVSGDGIGDLRGFMVKSDGELVNFFADHGATIERSFITKYNSGAALYFVPQSIVAGADLNSGFTVQRTVGTCEQVSKDFERLTHLTTLGDFFIAPIFSNIEIKPNLKKFRILLGNNTSILDCRDLASRLRK